MEEITGDEAKSLAKSLTDNHPTTLFGMVKAASPDFKLSSGSKITSLKVKSINNHKCDISIITCRGDLCEMKSATYNFDPPLRSAKDLADVNAERFKTIHNKVCAPKVEWLVTNPLALIILITCLALAYGTIVMGVDEMVDSFAQAPRLEAGISTIFQSTRIFAYWVVGSFWFSIIAHGIEAGIAYHHCSVILQLETMPTVTWMMLVFMVGYPIFSQLQELVATQQDDEKSK